MLSRYVMTLAPLAHRLGLGLLVAALGLLSAAPARAQTEALFCPWDDPEARCLELLEQAQATVDVAQYNIRNERFFQKLDELRARGVRVRIVVDAKNAENPWNTLDDAFEAAGFELRRYRNTASTYAIMHHKFTVIDGQVVLSGSYNWNGTAQLVNDENMVVLRDPALAAAYEQEFAELWGEAAEAPGVGGGPGAEVLFSPEDRPRDAIVAAIRAARTRVRVAVFTFKDRDVARALADAARAGVEVTLLTERKQADTTGEDERVAQAGGRVIVAANTSSPFSAMHHKFCVIDDELVITGACNWTWTAFTNSNEDVLLLRDPALAARYTQAFGALVRRYDPAGFRAADYGIAAAEAQVHVVVRMDRTAPGDTVLVVGDHPALGAWDPAAGLELHTSESTFPSWTARLRLPAGAQIAWKAVVRDAAGAIRWELGADRRLVVDPDGAPTFVEGDFRELVPVTVRACPPAGAPAGSELRLVGAAPELGAWDPAAGLLLTPLAAEPGVCAGTLVLPGRTEQPCKLALLAPDGTITWEQGWDRWLEVHDQDAPQTIELGAFAE